MGSWLIPQCGMCALIGIGKVIDDLFTLNEHNGMEWMWRTKAVQNKKDLDDIWSKGCPNNR